MKLSNYINGAWQAGTGEQFSVINPADGQTVWQGNAAAEAEVKQACNAARNSFVLEIAWTRARMSLQ